MNSVLKTLNPEENIKEAIAMSKSTSWKTICRFDDLAPNVGVRALLGEQQVAIFRVSGSDDVYAIDAYDPFSEAAVLSHGIVGDIKSEIVVASPIYKQHFSLRTGQCLEDESVKVNVYATQVVDGFVQLASPDE